MTVRVVTRHPRYGAVGTDLSDLPAAEQRLAVLSGYARDEVDPALPDFDPTDKNVDVVLAALDIVFSRNDEPEVRRILAAEVAGKDRATVRQWAAEHMVDVGDEGDA